MWKLGFAMREIMPQALDSRPYYLGGYGIDRPATGVLDGLNVRAAALSCGGKPVLLALLDSVGMLHPDCLELRRRVNERTGGAFEAVEILFTHSHSAFDTTGLWGPEGKSGRDAEYISLCADRTAECAAAALEDMRGGRLSFGHTNVGGLIEDNRVPVIIDPRLSRWSFVPDDGSAPTDILHFTCHPTTLPGSNTLVSADYLCPLYNRFEGATGGRCLCINGAIGGHIHTNPFYDRDGNRLPPLECCALVGNTLARAALGIDTAPVPELIEVRSAAADVPLANFRFEAAAKAGIVNERLIPGPSPTGLVKRTEVGYLRLGEVRIALMPGELFGELNIGGLLHDAHAANPGAAPERTVQEIFGRESYSLVFGPANDAMGYIIPANDYFIDPERPFVARGYDRLGRRHYEETNGVGPDAARVITETLYKLYKERG